MYEGIKEPLRGVETGTSLLLRLAKALLALVEKAATAAGSTPERKVCIHVRVADAEGNVLWDDICLSQLLVNVILFANIVEASSAQLASGEVVPVAVSDSPQQEAHDSYGPTTIIRATLNIPDATQRKVDLIRNTPPGTMISKSELPAPAEVA